MSKTFDDFVQEHMRSPEGTAAYVHELIAGSQRLSDERLRALELRLGGDSTDLELHGRACAIRSNLEAMRAIAYSTFYLLPELEEENER